MNEPNEKGIREQIASAPDADTVEQLLIVARNYKMISERTRRACERTAKRRLKQLEQETA